MAFNPSCSPGSAPNMDQHPSPTPWLQIPPSVMPWTNQNRPRLVRFGEPSEDAEIWGITSHKVKHHKRKTEQDYNMTPPAKVHITEEKMAAQLKNMHISNDNFDEEELGIVDEGSNCSLPTLSLSKEVQNLRRFNELFLPDTFVPRHSKSKAVVLWRPPAGSLTTQFISNIQPDSESEDADSTNNNSTTTDLNPATTSRFPPGSSTEMEM